MTALAFLDFAHNNTYDYQAITDEQYAAAYSAYTSPGGCKDLAKLCRQLGEIGDPEVTGRNATVNEVCVQAFAPCLLGLQNAFLNPDVSLASHQPPNTLRP